MNGERFSQRDTDTDRLRTVIAAIDRELALLPTSEGDGVPATQPLRSSWAELVELLAVEPARRAGISNQRLLTGLSPAKASKAARGALASGDGVSRTAGGQTRDGGDARV